jgi:hypothetical protein
LKWVRRLAIAAGVAVTLGVIVRLLLDPIATRQTRDALGRLDGFEGDFSRVHVTVLPPGYDIDRLKIWKSSASARHDPLFFAKRIRVRLRGAQLLHGRLVADLRIEEPKIAILHAAEPAPEIAPREAKAPDLAPQLADALPFRLARLEVVRGERALREFQNARNLPATGVPDDATVRALGLDPEKIFRRAPPD